MNKHKLNSFYNEQKERDRLLEIIIKKYGDPVLVHAVDNEENFMSILRQKTIKLPLEHKKQKKCPYMENLLGVDNSVFLSLGFVYYTDYNLKYNLIFNMDILKDSDFYKRPLPFKCYRAIVDYLYKNHKNYLDKAIQSSEKLGNILKNYIEAVETKQKVRLLKFWEAEEELFNLIMGYPKKDKLIKKAMEVKKRLLIKWPYSKRSCRQRYMFHDCPEILHQKNINLLENPAFMGFFIPERIPTKILKILKEKYKGKILFDGNKIEMIK